MQIKDNNADYIISLPTNDIEPSEYDIQIINTLFSNKKETSNNSYILDSLLLIVLFVIFSSPTTDDLITKFVHINYPMISIIKAIIIVCIFWTCKYIIN